MNFLSGCGNVAFGATTVAALVVVVALKIVLENCGKDLTQANRDTHQVTAVSSLCI